MTLRDIAFKNIKGNFNRYVMYYLSNTLVVMVFFIFANFIYNPALTQLKTLGTKGALAANAMGLCQVVILIFTFLFTLYSIANFLKSREKEFGLLSMFGLTKTEIRKYVMYENLLVSSISIATGLLLGILFSKLFFMAITVILFLDTEIPFTISSKAVLITVFSFIVLFQGINFLSTFRIKSRNIIELLKGSKEAQPVPKFSVKKTVLAIVFIAIGYAMAVFSGVAIIITMFPILFFTVTGTYYLFSQFSIFATSKLKNNPKVFYKGINMISLSQILYKLKDNAKVLFIVATLAAVTLTASATVYSVQQSLKAKLQLSHPQDISFIETGLQSQEVISPQLVEDILQKHGHEVSFKNKTILLKATNVDAKKIADKDQQLNLEDFYLMSNSDYNLLANNTKKAQLSLAEGEVVINSYPPAAFNVKSEPLFKKNELLSLDIGGEVKEFKVEQSVVGGIINADWQDTNITVVSDNDFKRLANATLDREKVVYYGYQINDWQRATTAVQEIKQGVPEQQHQFFTERITGFTEFMQTMSLILFIGVFIGVLFFIATGSIIYFKMFNEIQRDSQEFLALKKIGMTNGEMKKIVSTQSFIVFFLPFLVAISHSAFAIKALSNLLLDNLTIYFLTVVGVYFMFQLSYYLFAKMMYMKQVKKLGV